MTIRSVDTDVVVLPVAFFNTIALHELWLAFGIGPRYLAIHEFVASRISVYLLAVAEL